MFSRFKDFLYRHRRKFLFGGLLAGGMVFASKYAEQKFIEWQERERNILLEKQKRRQHFDSTKRTANTTIFSLSSSLKEVIVRELDSDTLLQAIRDQPATKHISWEQLKIVAFSRTICTVYSSSLLAAVVHVQLMLLGGYTYGDLINEGHAGVSITQQVQRRYLLLIQDFVTNGLVDLIETIGRAVYHTVNGLSLSRSLTIKQLEGVFQEIVLSLTGEKVLQEASNTGSFVLHPWSYYVTRESLNAEESSSNDAVEQLLKNMIVETSDVLDSNDFNCVVQTLIQQGLNHILDRVTEYYPTNNTFYKNANNNIETHTNENSDIKDISSPSTDEDDKIVNISPDSIVEQPETYIWNAELPVAKLIPLLCHLVHGALSPAHGQLIQKLINDGKLETLSYSVYEGFSIPLMNSN